MFPEKQKLKEFTTRRTTLEVLKEALQAEGLGENIF